MESESITNTTNELNLTTTNTLLTKEEEEEEEEGSFNIFTIGPLTRQHLLIVYTCSASNSNLTKPVAIEITFEMSCEYYIVFFVFLINIETIMK